MRRASGILLALVTTAFIVAGSHIRLGDVASDAALVRVSWSARPERVETCRRLSDAEYAQLPVHMRRRVVCEGTTARYELRVLRDSVLLAVDTVRGGGLRHDRELYALREVRVPAGASRIAVRFVRLDSSATADELLRADTAAGADTAGAGLGDRAAREDVEREQRRAEAIPPHLVLDTTLSLAPRTVLLVTYSDAARRLTARTSPP